MLNPLEEILAREIVQNGPVDIGRFMQLALTHPECGYYMKRDVFGRDGDFITAPEISQMFGEMIGIWLADCWMKLGSPTEFNLVEAGPGRGTLMRDILQATRHIEGFHAAANICLIEISPHLKTIQKKTLSGYEVSCYGDLNSIDNAAPLLFVGNEILDAFPIRQLQFVNDLWCERVISFSDDKFKFGLKNFSQELAREIVKDYFAPKENDVAEFSMSRQHFFEKICAQVRGKTGAALFIDYGYLSPAYGDTLQAVRAHEYASILEDIGQCDLTSHVNFSALKNAISHVPDLMVRSSTQGAFLNAIGIEYRAQNLIKKNPDRRDMIASELDRLTARNQMGELFKVMAVTCNKNMPFDVAGF